MDYQDIIYEVRDNVAYITINRPDVLNALRMQTKEELEDAVDKTAADDSILGLIITGVGRSFISGNDISEIRVDAKGEETVAMSTQAHRLFDKFEAMGKPIIAAVNGYALGGGTELALACDLRIASEKAVFGLPEVGLGVAPCYGGTQRLPRLIGAGPAKEMLFTGRKVKAPEALALGLVNKVVPADDLAREADAMMASILKKRPHRRARLQAAGEPGPGHGPGQGPKAGGRPERHAGRDRGRQGGREGLLRKAPPRVSQPLSPRAPSAGGGHHKTSALKKGG